MLEYREELSAYKHGILELKEVLTVGCLDEKHIFPTGEVSPNLTRKLRDILTCNNSHCSVSVNSIRGHRSCPICGQGAAFWIHDGSTLLSWNEIDKITDSDRTLEICILGNSETWIPNKYIKDNCFATHDLIYHYISDHKYLPPQDFIDSVIGFDIESDFIAEKEYSNCVRKYSPTFISVWEMIEKEYGIIP